MADKENPYSELQAVNSALSELSILENAVREDIEHANSTVPYKDNPLVAEEVIMRHESLLQQYSDLLHAAQHPLANEKLKDYSMRFRLPDRMWKFGIQGLLAILKPQPSDLRARTLSFIDVAYQHLVRLYSASFTSEERFRAKWCERLGELGCHRMTLETSAGDRETQRATAEAWFTRASHHTPGVGRLYARLAEVSTGRGRGKLSLYARAMAAVEPHGRARRRAVEFVRTLPGAERAISTSIDLNFAFLWGMLLAGTAESDRFDMTRFEFFEQLERSVDLQCEEWEIRMEHFALTLAAGASCVPKGGERIEDSRPPSDRCAGAVHLMATILAILLRRPGNENVLPYVYITTCFVMASSKLKGGYRCLEAAFPFAKLSRFRARAASDWEVTTAKEQSATLREERAMRGQLWAQDLFMPTSGGGPEAKGSAAKKIRRQRIVRNCIVMAETMREEGVGNWLPIVPLITVTPATPIEQIR